MNFIDEYNRKKVTADEAVKIINSGDWVDYGFSVTTVDALDQALAKRTDELENVHLRGAILPKIPAVFERADAGEHFSWNSWHFSGYERQLANRGLAFYAPISYSELPRYYRDMDNPSRIVMMQVAPMDQDGYFNFGPSASHLAAACERAEHIIVEVNQNVPYCFGGTEAGVHISKVDYIVEGNNPPVSPFGTGAAPSEVDKAIAQQIVEHIPNGACLQLGIGGMPNAVGTLIANSDLKELGVHTEIYSDGFVDIANAGKITGQHKTLDPGRQTFVFAAGTQKVYDYIHNNPEMLSAPADYVNDIRNIAMQDNLISINNCVDIDLYGQVSSESSGFKQITGAGGQLDFVLGAYLSKGGKSFICCSSTFTDKQGILHSRIRPTLTPGSAVTATRACVQYVATENGMVNLKGLSTWQRAEAIISIAHSAFRDELIKEAEKMGIWRRSK
ncbi:MAG: butyryl-CoA:acetate CoA-transferase [Agathobacter sp.]|nr:butyryl-CoA:acetate CoA-transferase [Agathobacter sp.]